MALYIDNQTQDDLVIFSKRGRSSIYSLFNQTQTVGGADMLEEWLRYPLSDGKKIDERSAIIQHFAALNIPFPFQRSWFDQCTAYLDFADSRSKLNPNEPKLGRAFQSIMGLDKDHQKIMHGIAACTQILGAWKAVLASDTLSWYQGELNEAKKILHSTRINEVPVYTDLSKVPYPEIVRMDNLFRFEEKEIMLHILHHIYILDVYMTVAKVANEKGFTFAKVDDSGEERLIYEGVYHPLIAGAKGNDLALNQEEHIVFLTGANMAGKSTLMKALGIALYLAHVGFPVAAKGLCFSVRDALYTSINLPDNLQMGYSHFFAEVLRVKAVAEQIAAGKKLFVIFDELFRGTNVKDAHEGTLAITSRVYAHRSCQFIISTHIIEAGDTLKETCPHIRFVYLPTLLQDGVPQYPYTLKEGITADRHGMVIIHNEGILDLLNHNAPTV
ncbi:MutS-related protein [Sphingobacterium sp. Mn56C]|uniref:MutS-related protein n=1 Tax=Sphingobacterium sp. Mn56C TaxID=3395261 RepID=UPI003BEA9338